MSIILKMCTTHLLFKHGVMGGNEVSVEIPDPVSYEDGEGQDEEDDQEERVEWVAPVQEAQHRDEEEETQGDVQIPDTWHHDDTRTDTWLENGTWRAIKHDKLPE